MPIFIRLLPRNVLFIKGFWRMEMERGKFGGSIQMISLKTGKTREESTVYPQLGENAPNPSHFPVFPYEICWMTNRWFYQHGPFVVSCREPFEIFTAEISPQFLLKFRFEMRGKFPWICKPFNSPKNWHSNIIGIFFRNWDPLYGLLWHSEILREIWGKFPCGNIPGDSLGKIGGNIHIENSPSFLLDFCRGNYEEISKAMIPWNSPIIPCGNLADVDGLPAGLIAF